MSERLDILRRMTAAERRLYVDGGGTVPHAAGPPAAGDWTRPKRERVPAPTWPPWVRKRRATRP